MTTPEALRLAEEAKRLAGVWATYCCQGHMADAAFAGKKLLATIDQLAALASPPETLMRAVGWLRHDGSMHKGCPPLDEPAGWMPLLIEGSPPPQVPDPEGEPRLWLWKNFVDGRPEYWAFDNPFPVHLDCGDPQTLGEPCGYAIVKASRAGRHDVSDKEVLRRIAASSPPAPPVVAEPASVRDCGEAGCAEGRCGNLLCCPPMLRPAPAQQLLPLPGSIVASISIDMVLKEYGFPANPKNAARAGFEAARRMLAARAIEAAVHAQPQTPTEGQS